MRKLMIIIKKLLLLLLITSFVKVYSEPLVDQEFLFNSVLDNPNVFEEYDTEENLNSLQKLNEVEQRIDQLRAGLEIRPDEPRIYYAISYLYRVRGEMLSRNISYENRNEWFSIPVVKENSQGIRDNLTEVARLLEEGKGKSMKVGGTMSSIISVQLDERFQRLFLKQNPNGIFCSPEERNNAEGDECMGQPYNEIALETLKKVATEYAGYGYFDDAARVIKDIAEISEEGKAKAAELEIQLAAKKEHFNPDSVREELAIMLPGGTPKPLTIRAADAIAEHHKAAAEKAQAEKNKVLEVQAQAASSAAAIVAAENLAIEKAEKIRQMWIAFAGALGLIVVVAGILVMKRRKSQV